MRRKSITCMLLVLSLVLAIFAMPSTDVSAVGDRNILVQSNGSGGSFLFTTSEGTGGPWTYANKTLPYGEYIELEAIPKKGYRFVNWTDSEMTDVNNVLTFEGLYYDLKLYANFEPIPSSQKSIYINSNILGAGKVTLKINGKVHSTGKVLSAGASYGNTYSVSVEAAPGYVFTGWSGSSSSKNTMISGYAYSDVTLTANFEKDYKKIVVNPNMSGAGTIKLTQDGSQIASGASISEACEAGTYSLTATANKDYNFLYWDVGDGQVKDNPYTFGHGTYVDYEIKAVFEKKSSTPPPTEKPVTPPPTTAPEYDDPVVVGDDHLIREFVERLYTLVLCRTSDEGGMNFWTNELYTYKRTGGQVALDMFMSPEMTGRNLSDETYVEILYSTFFSRSAAEDPSGYNYWLGELRSGMSRQEVVQRFIDSQEWADTCNDFGILSGSLAKSEIAIPPTSATYDFVKRIYLDALGRPYDEEGLNYWALSLSNYEMTGEFVGAFFFLCDEMEGLGLSNDQYLTRLYETFMGREPEPEGYNYWMGRLNSGMSRTELVYSFTRSEEFVDKCIAARIVPYGDLGPTVEAMG